MIKKSAKSLATFTARKSVRVIRALGAPFANAIKARDRRRAGLVLPIDRPVLAKRIGDRSALELGPFFTPLLKGANVSYFDVLDRPALRKRAKQVGGIVDGVPEIEFVSPIGDLAVVDRRFDVVLSAHVIEHQPDLIRHLEAIADILYPNGEYWLVVPDRRYSFDQAFSESSLNAVLDAHAEGRKIHSVENITMHLTQTVHNNALLHWLGWHAQGKRSPDFRQFAEAEVVRAQNNEYVDVHAWIFTPASFKRIVDELYRMKLTRLKVAYVTDTAFGKLEFFACLKIEPAD